MLVDSNVVYSFNAGADNSDLFNIDPLTGQISFKNAPDWETPLDADRNNVDLPTSRVNLDLVRNTQRAVAGADSKVFLVNTDALGAGADVLKAGDPMHYNAAGQVALGNALVV